MNYADIKQFDVANGPGVRVSLFVSGCTHHCKNCFNPETWDFNFGAPFTVAEEDLIVEYLKPDHISGLTLLGGDPLEPENAEALLPLLKKVKSAYPDKPLWCFTGFLYEQLVDRAAEFLSYVDVLVDGPFIEEQKDLRLRFKGSANQRIIRVQESIKAGEIILWDPACDN